MPTHGGVLSDLLASKRVAIRFDNGPFLRVVVPKDL